MKKTWKDQFLESFNSSKTKTDADYTASAINHFVSEANDESNREIFFNVIPDVLEALAADHKYKELDDLSELINICESHIEVALGLALKMLNCVCVATEVIFNVYGDNLSLPEQIAPTRVVINPQAKILSYRVDFLATSSVLDFQTRAFIKRSVIIECDGHDFHEKTKEQAKRDKKKDRELQAKGYRVFRFTGSEIWNNVFQCAEEVFNFLTHPKKV